MEHENILLNHISAQLYSSELTVINRINNEASVFVLVSNSSR